MRRERFLPQGILALSPQAFGFEFEILGGVPDAPFEEADGVAVVSVRGPLEQHQHPFWLDYDTLRKRVAEAFDSPTSRAVALCVDSPGGSAAGCIELARALRAMSDESGKPLGVFVDGEACSAAYAIACAATAGIWAPPTAKVASIGVYDMMVDASEQDRQLGLRFVFIPSTGADLKLSGNPHMAPSEPQIKHRQSQVDQISDYFYALVQEMRGIPIEEVRELRGAVLLAAQGEPKRLVDGITDRSGFLEKLRTPQRTTMGTAQAKTSDPFEDALAKLTEATRSEDPEVARRAKKMLADHYKAETKAAEDGDDKPADKPKDGEDDKAKAEADEKEKARAAAEEDDKAKAAKAEEEKKMQAQARAGGAANEALLAKMAELEKSNRDLGERVERDKLLASRPDISPEVRDVLAVAPLAVVQKAVKDLPRVSANATAAAAAAMAGGETRGRDDSGRGKWSGNEQRLLDKLDGKTSEGATRGPVMEGSRLVLNYMSPGDAARRAQEMLAQGLVPAHRSPQNVTSTVLPSKG